MERFAHHVLGQGLFAHVLKQCMLNTVIRVVNVLKLINHKWHMNHNIGMQLMLVFIVTHVVYLFIIGAFFHVMVHCFVQMNVLHKETIV